MNEENAERNENAYKNVEEAMEGLKNREQSDITRYTKYYNIDIHNPKNFDLIIDSTDIPAEEVVQKILDSLPK